ncbi:hypothetical protein QQ054_38420, partial [Oscillatoria amoena NRMC-F 0135]|nr:hypothetical protein [Oscillatoria amoena NRMC-F 0135]
PPTPNSQLLTPLFPPLSPSPPPPIPFFPNSQPDVARKRVRLLANGGVGRLASRDGLILGGWRLSRLARLELQPGDKVG